MTTQATVGRGQGSLWVEQWQLRAVAVSQYRGGVACEVTGCPSPAPHWPCPHLALPTPVSTHPGPAKLLGMVLSSSDRKNHRTSEVHQPHLPALPVKSSRPPGTASFYVGGAISSDIIAQAMPTAPRNTPGGCRIPREGPQPQGRSLGEEGRATAHRTYGGLGVEACPLCE